MGLFSLKKILAFASMLVIFTGCSDSGNKEFDMALGSNRRIGGGATLWFGSVEDQWRADLGGIVTAAMVEVKCPNESSGLMPVFSDRPTEKVCGVSLRLVEFKDGFIKPAPKHTVYRVRLQLIREKAL